MIDRDAPEAASAGQSERHLGRLQWRTLFLPAVLFVLVFIQAGTLAVKVKAISAFDEGAHFDYVLHLQEGDFPLPAGVRYTEEAIQVWACRPVDKAMSLAPFCREANSSLDPRLPFLGVNYEATYGPVYYGVAAVGSSILSNFGIGDFAGTRFMSAFLFALGAALLLLVAQRMAFSSLAAGGTILAASSTPLALSMGATVTPDSMAFLVTAVIIAAAVLSRSWRTAVLTTALVGGVAGVTKPNFIVIALLGSLLLLLRWISAERPAFTWATARRFLAIGPMMALPVVCSAATSFGWAALAAARNTTGMPSDGGVHIVLQSALSPIDRVIQQFSAMLRPDAGAAFTVLDDATLGVAGFVLIIATLGACLGAWLYRIDADARSVIVLRAVALAIPVSAVVIVAIYWIAYQGSNGISTRYALPFLAAASAGLGASLARRAAIPMGLFGMAVWLCAWVSFLA